MSLENRVAVVTGGSRGLGEAMAIRLAQDGATVAILDIDQEAASDVVGRIQRLGSQAIALKTDVGQVAQIRGSLAAVVEEYGRLDILINNAGIVLTTSIDKITEDEWRKVIDINLNSVFFASQEAMRPMMTNKWGRIINISSMAGRQGSIVAGCHYGAAKAAILGITKNFARYLAPYNVTVNAIAPGPIMSDIVRGYTEEKKKMLRESSPLGRIGEPSNIAETAAFLCTDGADYMTGATLDVNGGIFMG
jgi:NAD(P)-dependent dehydrogenase (short-subunit alcohol dehydrogenase family)